MQNIYFLLFLCSLLTLCPDVAHAYIDPGSGSLVIQIIFSALVSGVVAVKLFWCNLKAWFARCFRAPPRDGK